MEDAAVCIEKASLVQYYHYSDRSDIHKMPTIVMQQPATTYCRLEEKRFLPAANY